MSRIVQPKRPHHQLRVIEGSREFAVVEKGRGAYLWIGPKDNDLGTIYTFNLTPKLRAALKRLK